MSLAAPDRANQTRALLAISPLIVGFLALAAPTIQSLGQQVWSRESGAHGPIVLATAAWLIWRDLPAMREKGRPGAAWLTTLLLAMALGLYVFGRAFDFISLEALGLYGVFVTMLQARFGLPTLLRHWFQFFYLGFVVPPPQWLLDQVTGPLKEFVSHAAVSSLSMFGIPLAREGVTIFVAQYQLLMEDACSGLNSLVGLTAISLFYIFLLRGSSWRYSALLTLFIIPIAIAGNIIRVMILILLTYFFGDEVAQGFLHYTAGFFVFVIGLVLVYLVDLLLIKLVPKSWRPS
jgi:exosortase